MKSHSPIPIEEANLLVVGAGGIGCELLKCLVMSGFKRISIVDMDTIEKSNLNRQFLFNADSIGKFKSEMAVKRIKMLKPDPSLNLKAYIGNIKDKELFPEDFFSQFHIILNALDNLDARYYINLVCMRANIPLVNSGSEGYLGSIGCHLLMWSPCYNCLNKVRKKTIPICSIRLHPEKIEHCVAWGKALFERLFEAKSYHCRSNEDLIGENDFNDEDIVNTLKVLFNEDIIALEHKHKLPIDITTILAEHDLASIKAQSSKAYSDFISNPSNEDKNSHRTEQLLLILYASYDHLLRERPISFDKENDAIINFIFSSSNLRAMNFYLSQESKFKIKEIAGNIIPAISSTNSIVAAIQVIECLKILKGQITQCKNVGLTKNRKVISSTSTKEVINPECLSCSKEMIARSFIKSINLTLDMEKTTLDMFINQYCEAVSFDNDWDQYLYIEVNGQVIYETNDDLDEEEIEDYRKLKERPLASFHFYKDMLKNKKIEVLVFNSKTNYLLFKYNLIQSKQYVDKPNDDETTAEISNLLGKKRKFSND